MSSHHFDPSYLDFSEWWVSPLRFQSKNVFDHIGQDLISFHKLQFLFKFFIQDFDSHQQFPSIHDLILKFHLILLQKIQRKDCKSIFEALGFEQCSSLQSNTRTKFKSVNNDFTSFKSSSKHHLEYNQLKTY